MNIIASDLPQNMSTATASPVADNASTSTAALQSLALNPVKFGDPKMTADGKPRAHVEFQSLQTLWLNTGTLCNLACEHCYIESSPSNDQLVYLSQADVRLYLQEIADHEWPTREIGITGGEPFMNPEIVPIIEDCLEAGFEVLVLTNAMRPMMKLTDELLRLRGRYPKHLKLRVSVDHFTPELHQQERGTRSWAPMIKGLQWLGEANFNLSIAGRLRWGEEESALRAGFKDLFDQYNLQISADDDTQLMLFPEMDPNAEVPEITTDCFGLLQVDPNQLMCANTRMIVRRKGADTSQVVACTLIPYETEFSFDTRLADSLAKVSLNHPHCAKFCVLGGASCSV